VVGLTANPVLKSERLSVERAASFLFLLSRPVHGEFGRRRNYIATAAGR
jgi:hypothetical protein